MKYSAVAAIVLLFACGPCLADALADPEKWYRNDYAPLWSGKPGDNIKRLKTFYVAEVTTHEAEGPISRTPRQSWLVEPMKEWLAEGWLTAELTGLITQRINASTAAFTARWLDRYEGGATEVSCGWYLADVIDGRWVFTEYADTDCGAHEFD